MKMLFFISFLLVVTLNSYSQQINIYPTIGFLYTGLTNYGNAPKAESDFKSPIPAIAEYAGFEITYKRTNSIITHKLTLQRTVIGQTMQISSFERLGINGLRYKHYTAVEQLLLSYQLQLMSKSNRKFLKTKSLKLLYSLGFGIGFNKSKSYYDEQFYKEQYYQEYQNVGTPGLNFLGWDAAYKRRGIGIFIVPEVGAYFYNKKRKPILSATLFYDIGLKQMIESQQHYFYGNTLQPNIYVERYQKLFSRGSVFGFKIGIPIKIK
jgi:hypothetical protein